MSVLFLSFWVAVHHTTYRTDVPSFGLLVLSISLFREPSLDRPETMLCFSAVWPTFGLGIVWMRTMSSFDTLELQVIEAMKGAVRPS